MVQRYDFFLDPIPVYLKKVKNMRNKTDYFTFLLT